MSAGLALCATNEGDDPAGRVNPSLNATDWAQRDATASSGVGLLSFAWVRGALAHALTRNPISVALKIK
jgi:hypothetical protein